MLNVDITRKQCKIKKIAKAFDFECKFFFGFFLRVRYVQKVIFATHFSYILKCLQRFSFALLIQYLVNSFQTWLRRFSLTIAFKFYFSVSSLEKVLKEHFTSGKEKLIFIQIKFNLRSLLIFFFF